MSLNIYDSEQKVFFSEKPTMYFGWQFSFNGNMFDINYFSSAKKKKTYVKQGLALLKNKFKDLDQYDAEAVVALAVLTHTGKEFFMPLEDISEKNKVDSSDLDEFVEDELSELASKIELG